VAKCARANPFSIAVIAILLAIIGVLSRRLEKAEPKHDISAKGRPPCPHLSVPRPDDDRLADGTIMVIILSASRRVRSRKWPIARCCASPITIASPPMA
jgi:hypothetical protein